MWRQGKSSVPDVVGSGDSATPVRSTSTHRLAGESVAQRAIRLGGTCTGEHGIGRHRIRQLHAERADGVALMRAVEHALDPRGMMNPGKMPDR